MGIFDRFPYSSTHEMNLDFMLGKATEIAEDMQTVATGMAQVQAGLSAISEKTEQATQAAAQAAQSASSIEGSVTAAEEAAEEAQMHNESAQTWANNALTYKADCQRAATEAAASSSSAAQAATAAAGSEDTVAQYAQAANASAQSAANNNDSAHQYANQASASASNATFHSSNAQTAATNANTSATNAETAATNAQTAATRTAALKDDCETLHRMCSAAVDQAATEAVNAANSAAQAAATKTDVETLVESLPEDFTDLNNHVNQLSDEIDVIKYGYSISTTEGILTNNGTIYNSPGTMSKITGKIPCQEGERFTYKGRGSYSAQSWCFFNDNTVVGYGQHDNINAATEVVIPQGCNFVQFASYAETTNPDNIVLVVNNADWVSLSEVVTQLENVNPLYGKKLAVSGDSICAGAGYAGGYAKIISENNSMSVQNIAVGGGTLASGTMSGETQRFWINEHISDLDTDADYIILEGGVNDASLNVPLGAITNGFAIGSFDTSTFYGALESCFTQMLERFPGKKIGYILVHKCSVNLRPGTDYYNAIFNCAEKWGIPVLNLNIELPGFAMYASTNPLYTTLTQAYTNNGDGWHPNEQGYRKYYVPKIEAWMKTL